MIITDSATHIIVFDVSIDSPSRYQVKIGKIRNPTLDPTNLADHTEPKLSLTFFQAYQKKMLAGIPNTIAEASGLSDHHFDIN